MISELLAVAATTTVSTLTPTPAATTSPSHSRAASPAHSSGGGGHSALNGVDDGDGSESHTPQTNGRGGGGGGGRAHAVTPTSIGSDAHHFSLPEGVSLIALRDTAIPHDDGGCDGGYDGGDLSLTLDLHGGEEVARQAAGGGRGVAEVSYPSPSRGGGNESDEGEGEEEGEGGEEEGEEEDAAWEKLLRKYPEEGEGGGEGEGGEGEGGGEGGAAALEEWQRFHQATVALKEQEMKERAEAEAKVSVGSVVTRGATWGSGQHSSLAACEEEGGDEGQPATTTTTISSLNPNLPVSDPNHTPNPHLVHEAEGGDGGE